MAFTDPLKNIQELGVSEGMSVADFGAGTGAYALPLAQAVGPMGRVYAVEVQKELVATLKSNAQAKGIGNIEVIWGDIEESGGTKLQDNLVDIVVISNTLFQVENKEGLLAEAKRIVKPGGRILIVEWKDSFGGMGPHPDQVVPAHVAKSLIEQAGFAYERSINAGGHHYGFVGRKAQ